MDVAAILVLFPTVLLGAVVLGLWADARMKTDRRSVVLAVLHVSAALVAVTLWLVFAVGEKLLIGWLGLGLLAATMLLGVSTLMSSRASERLRPVDESPTPVPAGALLLHGGFALLAGALAVAAVAGR